MGTPASVRREIAERRYSAADGSKVAAHMWSANSGSEGRGLFPSKAVREIHRARAPRPERSEWEGLADSAGRTARAAEAGLTAKPTCRARFSRYVLEKALIGNHLQDISGTKASCGLTPNASLWVVFVHRHRAMAARCELLAFEYGLPVRSPSSSGVVPRAPQRPKLDISVPSPLQEAIYSSTESRTSCLPVKSKR